MPDRGHLMAKFLWAPGCPTVAWCGHDAIKPTWLYIVGASRACIYPAPLAAGTRPLEHMSKRQRAATPLPFARWLVELAASAQRRQGVA